MQVHTRSGRFGAHYRDRNADSVGAEAINEKEMKAMEDSWVERSARLTNLIAEFMQCHEVSKEDIAFTIRSGFNRIQVPRRVKLQCLEHLARFEKLDDKDLKAAAIALLN